MQSKVNFGDELQQSAKIRKLNKQISRKNAKNSEIAWINQQVNDLQWCCRRKWRNERKTESGKWKWWWGVKSYRVAC